MTVTVNQPTTPTFTQVAPICANGTFTLPTVSNNGINGTWSPAINNLTTTTYTFTPSPGQCASTTTMTVTVNQLPPVSAGQDVEICAGESVTLTGSGAATYSWTGSISDGVSFIPTSSGTYILTGTSADGCVNTDQVVVTVNPIPTVNAGNDITICNGESVTLTATGANTYIWTNGVTNGISFTPPSGSTTYTVTGTTIAGCTDSDDVTVTVLTNLPVTFVPDVTTGCAPLTVSFTNTTVGGIDCYWSMGDGTFINDCGNVSNTFELAGCYDITLTVNFANGCDGTLTIPNLICVEENPIAQFNASNNQISEFDNFVQFNNNSINATNYSWDFGDNSSINYDEDPSHEFDAVEEGIYTVTLIASTDFGCTDTAQTTIQVYEELIYYIPNTFTPDNDMYNQSFKPVFTAGFDPFDYTLYIYNRWGELIFESKNALIGWDGTYGDGENVIFAQDGTYVWKVEFKTSKNDERKIATGHVNLIR